MSMRITSRFTFLGFGGLAFTACLLPDLSYAAVEFVTPVGGCNKVDQIGDGSDLILQAGANVRFEVWGSGIDINPSVRVTADDGNAGTVGARIISARSGPQNAVGPCRYATGSVQVEVDSPGGATQLLQRSLRFRMPAGDESRLQTSVRPFPKPGWKYNSSWFSEQPDGCLRKGVGSIVKDMQDKRVTITLPAGAAQDTSNCTLRLFTTIVPETTSSWDIKRSFNYSISGLPAFFRLYGTLGAEDPTAPKTVTLEADIAALRSVNSVRNVTMTVAAPNNRSDTLALVVNPPPVANAFTQAVNCYNVATGSTINVNDNFECELRLSQTPPPGGQLITFQAIDRLCVAAGSSAVTYSSVVGGGTFTAPATGTIHKIPLRALGGTSSAGSPCASQTSPVAHLLKFWIGDRDIESGPDFSQAQIRIRAQP